MATIGAIQAFNVKTDNWTLYQEQLEEFLKINSIVDTKKVSALLSLMGADTYKVLRDLCTPTLPKDKTYEDLCGLLKTHFSPTTCVYRERIEFYEATQGDSESVNDWYARIRNLSMNCEFGNNLQAILLDKFICGFKKGKIRDRLCEEKVDVKLEKILELALSKESSLEAEKKEIHVLKNSTGRKNFREGNKQFEQKPRQGRSQEHSIPGRSKPSRWQCKACGNHHTGRQTCKYSKYECNLCKKVGHLAKVCFNNNYRQNCLEADEEVQINNVLVQGSEATINTINVKNTNPIVLSVGFNDSRLSMQLDSGAGLSVVTKECYLRDLSHFKLYSTKVSLKSYTGCVIKPLGFLTGDLTYDNVLCKNFEIYVVDNGNQNLLGRDFLQKFKFKICMSEDTIMQLNSETDELISKYKEIFNGELGRYKYSEFKLQIKECAKPIFQKPRPIPLALKPKVEEELARLAKDGVITQVDNSQWGTPLVPVIKKGGGIRLCGDYKVTANKHFVEIKYPLPRIEEIFAKLSGGESYTKIDLSNAYNQLVLDEQSADICAWSTHKGIFRMNRLPYGITPSSAIFQKTIESLLQELNSCSNFVDDSYR